MGQNRYAGACIRRESGCGIYDMVEHLFPVKVDFIIAGSSNGATGQMDDVGIGLLFLGILDGYCPRLSKPLMSHGTNITAGIDQVIADLMGRKDFGCTINDITLGDTVQGDTHSVFSELYISSAHPDVRGIDKPQRAFQAGSCGRCSFPIGKTVFKEVYNRLYGDIKGAVADLVVFQCPVYYRCDFRGDILHCPLPVELRNGSGAVKTTHFTGQSVNFFKCFPHGLLGLILGAMKKGHGYKCPHGKSGFGDLVQFLVELYRFGA